MCDPVVAEYCISEEAGEERSPQASSQDPWHLASRWPWSSTEGHCREGSKEEDSHGEAEGEGRSPSPQAARS